MIDRDEHGRFRSGNNIGKLGGRPRRATEAEYLDMLSFAVPPERWRRIADAVARKAEHGDIRAAQVLASYLLGAPPTRPTAALNIDMGQLTESQLERIANGEDPIVVLATSTPSEPGAGAAGTGTA